MTCQQHYWMSTDQRNLKWSLFQPNSLSLCLLAVTNISQTRSRITCRQDQVDDWIAQQKELNICTVKIRMFIFCSLKQTPVKQTPSSAAKGKTHSFIANSLNYAVCRKMSKYKEITIIFFSKRNNNFSFLMHEIIFLHEVKPSYMSVCVTDFASNRFI